MVENDTIAEPYANGSQTNSTYHFHGYGTVVPLSLWMLASVILATGGNIMVVLTIVRHKGMRTRTNMFIVNLAVADILVALLDMPFSLITIMEGDWMFGNTMCKLNGFTMALLLICSIHTLMYISIHKYISITRPFSRAMTPKRIKIMIGATWLWAAFCAMGPLIGWNTFTYKTGASQCGPEVPQTPSDKCHSLFITVTNYVIPLSVMSFCYFRIFKEIHVHMGRIRETSNIKMENSVAQQRKVSITLFLVLICFFLCWTPYVIYSTVLSFMKDKGQMPYYINPIVYWCGYFNSACNPIIYAFRSPSFRKGYKEIMCGKDGVIVSNSHSFRIRSNHGSMKNASDNVKSLPSSRRGSQESSISRGRRTMLSQTSWMSLPVILVHGVSTMKGRHDRPDNMYENGDVDYCCCFPRSDDSKRRPSEIPTPEASYSRKGSLAFLDPELEKVDEVCETIEEGPEPTLDAPSGDESEDDTSPCDGELTTNISEEKPDESVNCEPNPTTIEVEVEIANRSHDGLDECL